METPLIEITDLQKVYGVGDIAVYALRKVSLNIRSGEFAAVMGPSGSGKSTLMNILGCLDRPTDGTYRLDGEDVSHMNRAELAGVRNRKIGFIFQSFNLLPRLSALKNVMLPMLYSDVIMPLEEREILAAEALERVGLGRRLHHRPNELSGGQQQRVAIARALINRPPLILADEPTGNLDTHSSAEIMSLLADLHTQGVTIAMVTHDPERAAQAERVICMRDGQVVSDGRGDRHECLERRS
ncbi:MAG: ABC transporter ATP-binding protein [Anaerolineae bacterium]|nr:ABC transporter ATP-binding protein [Anaerolineae bacterium]